MTPSAPRRTSHHHRRLVIARVIRANAPTASGLSAVPRSQLAGPALGLQYFGDLQHRGGGSTCLRSCLEKIFVGAAQPADPVNPKTCHADAIKGFGPSNLVHMPSALPSDARYAIPRRRAVILPAS
jgi:hypothetical protein